MNSIKSTSRTNGDNYNNNRSIHISQKEFILKNIISWFLTTFTLSVLLTPLISCCIFCFADTKKARAGVHFGFSLYFISCAVVLFGVGSSIYNACIKVCAARVYSPMTAHSEYKSCNNICSTTFIILTVVGALTTFLSIIHLIYGFRNKKKIQAESSEMGSQMELNPFRNK
jgi:hypothetical protein